MYHRYLQNENGRFHKQRIESAPTKKPSPAQQPQSDKSFAALLEKLISGFDSGDLLVILILLLLLAEGNEDSESVIMTLAIFLFLQ